MKTHGEKKNMGFFNFKKIRCVQSPMANIAKQKKLPSLAGGGIASIPVHFRAQRGAPWGRGPPPTAASTLSSSMVPRRWPQGADGKEGGNTHGQSLSVTNPGRGPECGGRGGKPELEGRSWRTADHPSRSIELWCAARG